MRTDATSVVMAASTASVLEGHLLRRDRQEDLCFATYRRSTGSTRTSVLLREVVLPLAGEREVHGNASFTGDYVVRAATSAAAHREGVVLLHSHPGGAGWQRLSTYDEDAERSYAYLVHEITGHPLIGMTLAGSDHTWSARSWDQVGEATWCESVRVVGEHLKVSWNGDLHPRPILQNTQLRTQSGWGDEIQADIARLRVLVVGAGSVGLDVALRLAAMGIMHIGIMDFDSVELVNLDRLIGTTVLDAWLHRAKIDVAKRLIQDAATAPNASIEIYDASICTPEGLSNALDYDVIFSCVDRPWPRAVLNMIAYADLIPVIDGGIHIDAFPDGGMRNATWRSHVIRPGRPCLACNKQLDLGTVSLDREGLLDDPKYIAGLQPSHRPARQNVAALSISVASSLLAQFVSLVAAPGGRGEPGPLQYLLSTHTLELLPHVTGPNCYFERSIAAGDGRLSVTGKHLRAERVQEARAVAARPLAVRFGRLADDALGTVKARLAKWVTSRLRRPR